MEKYRCNIVGYDHHPGARDIMQAMKEHDLVCIRRDPTNIETFFETISFRLEEIVNSIDEDGFEPVYEGIGFRPVRETDISIFTNMLKPHLEKVD